MTRVGFAQCRRPLQGVVIARAALQCIHSSVRESPPYLTVVSDVLVITISRIDYRHHSTEVPSSTQNGSLNRLFTKEWREGTMLPLLGWQRRIGRHTFSVGPFYIRPIYGEFIFRHPYTVARDACVAYCG